jgi:hypothetical protein
MRAGNALTNSHGCESILLAGTDLALVFPKGGNPGFDTLDCAEAHATAIAETAMTGRTQPAACCGIRCRAGKATCRFWPQRARAAGAGRVVNGRLTEI